MSWGSLPAASSTPGWRGSKERRSGKRYRCPAEGHGENADALLVLVLTLRLEAHPSHELTDYSSLAAALSPPTSSHQRPDRLRTAYGRHRFQRRYVARQIGSE